MDAELKQYLDEMRESNAELHRSDAELKQYLDEMRQEIAEVKYEVTALRSDFTRHEESNRQEFKDITYALKTIMELVATKSDLARLDTKIDRVHSELKEEISSFRKHVDDEISPEVDAVKGACKLNYEIEFETRARVEKLEHFAEGIKELAIAQ